jgi:hypothetical protein
MPPMGLAEMIIVWTLAEGLPDDLDGVAGSAVAG